MAAANASGRAAASSRRIVTASWLAATTVWNPGKTKVLHSHGPPAQAG